MADREGRQPASALDEHRVAKALGIDRADFFGKIKTRIECVRDLSAGAQRFSLPFIGQSAEPRPALYRLGLPRRRKHYGGQKPRIEPELLIKGHVFGTLCKSE